MRTLVLGGAGMLGHRVWRAAASRGEAWATIRNEAVDPVVAAVLNPDRVLGGVDARDAGAVGPAMAHVRPSLVVNCVGVVKQADESGDPLAAIEVNSLFPHRVARLCRDHGARLVHVSTDCVFSGRRGHYSEDDLPDPVDLYGRSKLLGEVSGPDCLTLRTSFIGRELRGCRGLLEWLLSQRGGRVQGFAHARFSGLTTAAVAGAVVDLGARHDVLGVYHLAAAPIDKLSLLTRIRDAFTLDVDIVPDGSVVVDRSLDGTALETASGWRPPTWEAMIGDLAADPLPYEQLRAVPC